MILTFLKTKIGISLLAAIILVGGAVALKSQQGTSDSKDSLSNKVGLIADTSIQNAIKNGDGTLPDWEATLASLTSTSSLDEKMAYLAQNASSSPENLTATDRFSREFLAEYVKLKASGATIDENTGMNLVNQLLAQDY